MNLTFTQIQQDIIKRYRVKVYDFCPQGCWGRTHAHIRDRMVCKWTAKSSVQSTFTLLHEIGHIETTTGKMRRCEEEFYATQWAIDRCLEYGIELPPQLIDSYQSYIFRELDRGLRRGGSNYPSKKEMTLRTTQEDTNINAIKLHREKAGLTQLEMSKIFEIPKRTIENWEEGSRKPPVWAEKLIIEKLERIESEK